MALHTMPLPPLATSYGLLWPLCYGYTHYIQVRICLGHHAVTGSEAPGKAMRVLEVSDTSES